MKTLIIYYSYGGNTKKIAEMIQQETDGDLAEIETVKPYTGDYNLVVSQGQKEVNNGFMPEIKPLSVDVSKYECIVLGSPVWWYTFAPAMKTFLSQAELKGKVIYPFATNGGWIGHTLKDFNKECRGADVKQGMNIVFDENNLRTAEADIKKWMKGIR